jgi:hypothetical protein
LTLRIRAVQLKGRYQNLLWKLGESFARQVLPEKLFSPVVGEYRTNQFLDDLKDQTHVSAQVGGCLCLCHGS